MDVVIYKKSSDGDWSSPILPDPSAGLVFLFANRELLEKLSTTTPLTQLFPNAICCGCSTAGEIVGEEVFEGSAVLSVIRFKHSQALAVEVPVDSIEDSFAAGCSVAQQLVRDDLKHILVFSDGIKVNGSRLVEGMLSKVQSGIGITGGLAGDGERFSSTRVFLNGECKERVVVGIGLYGDKLKVGYGSFGGWDPFGPERTITKSKDNRLYQLDGRSALGLYKEYLGSYADKLPGAALRFPLSIKTDGVEPLVRTVLEVNEEDQSIGFAGDIPPGKSARFMKTNIERLVDGAAEAASVAAIGLEQVAEFALLISCVGRRLVLSQRREEEVEAVREQLGFRVKQAGFYSYGEIAPFMKNAKCELHNQTMTVTAFSEDE